VQFHILEEKKSLKKYFKRMNKKFTPRLKSSYFRKPGDLEDRSLKKEKNIVFTFIDFDRNQGQSFEEWEKNGLLASLLNKISGVCQLRVAEAIHQGIIKVYTKVDFPPSTKFYHPRHIPDNVKWSSLHIKGKECIIGYFDDNIFHIVFFDKDHEFWICTKD